MKKLMIAVIAMGILTSTANAGVIRIGAKATKKAAHFTVKASKVAWKVIY